jgi:predicted component of type VI protein secretion system
MSTVEALPSATAVEAAIARVLRAEREAHEAVDRATRDAEALNERARADARALAERTERRIQSVRAAYERKVTEEVAAIDAQAAAQDVQQALSVDDWRRLERALEALAAALTGGDR